MDDSVVLVIDQRHRLGLGTVECPVDYRLDALRVQ